MSTNLHIVNYLLIHILIITHGIFFLTPSVFIFTKPLKKYKRIDSLYNAKVQQKYCIRLKPYFREMHCTYCVYLSVCSLIISPKLFQRDALHILCISSFYLSVCSLIISPKLSSSFMSSYHSFLSIHYTILFISVCQLLDLFPLPSFCLINPRFLSVLRFCVLSLRSFSLLVYSVIYLPCPPSSTSQNYR